MDNRQRKLDYEERKRAYYANQQKTDAAVSVDDKRKKQCYIVASALTALIILCIASAIVISSLFAGGGKTVSYTVKIGSDRSEAAMENGKILINLDKLIALLELQKTGSASTPKYTCRSGDSIEFQNGTRTAKITVSGTTAQSSVSMPLAVRADSEGCLVSLDTVSGIFSGITVTVNKSTVSIVRKNVAGSTTRFENVSILNKSGDPLSRVLYLTEVMKEYEQYINPADRDAYLVLASKESVLGESYVPPELVDLTGLVTELGVDASIVNFDAPNTQMDKYAAYALVAMLLDMRAEEYLNIVAQSGYRTYTYQENLFEKYVKQEMDKDSSLTREEAEAIVLTYSAAPGTSEHQTGLCIDLMDTRTNRFEPMENPFTTELGMQWLDENAWKYGFILRYPEGKEDITGYSYESWHFRYVGRYHAERISALGITLDEYLKLINK